MVYSQQRRSESMKKIGGINLLNDLKPHDEIWLDLQSANYLDTVQAQKLGARRRI
jgi:hypothetical protein